MRGGGGRNLQLSQEIQNEMEVLERLSSRGHIANHVSFEPFTEESMQYNTLVSLPATPEKNLPCLSLVIHTLNIFFRIFFFRFFLLVVVCFFFFPKPRLKH